MTVLEILKRTSEYFTKHGVESPRLNIEHLTAKVLGCGRMDLYMQFDRTLEEAQLETLRALVRRRITGEPLQHLLGDVEFLGQVFLSDARALIPRPETELLVELILRRYGPEGALQKKRRPKAVPLGEAPPVPEQAATDPGETRAHPPVRLLDVAAGSGVIALSLARHWPGAEVTATDISPEALALASANAQQLGLGGQVRFLQGDLYAALPGGDAPYAGIAANLPYIPSGDLPGLQREVQFDPVLALDGGADGLDLVRRLVAGAPPRLEALGWLALEIGIGQGEAVAALLREAGFSEVEVVEDYNEIGRFVFGRMA